MTTSAATELGIDIDHPKAEFSSAPTVARRD
jgi:hypothetical protein